MHHTGYIRHLRCLGLPLAFHVALDNGGFCAVRRLHGEHVVEIVARLIQQVIQAVTGFRNVRRAILKSGCAALIGIQQRPDADAAIHHIFALVTGIIPPAGDIQRIVTAGPADLVHVLAMETGQHFFFVSGRTRPLLAASMLGFNRNAGTVVVEVSQRIVFEVAEDIFRNVKWMALSNTLHNQHEVGRWRA